MRGERGKVREKTAVSRLVRRPLQWSQLSSAVRKDRGDEFQHRRYTDINVLAFQTLKLTNPVTLPSCQPAKRILLRIFRAQL